VTDPAGKPKAIVIGDYSIISDDVLLEMASGSEVTNNYEFFRSGLEWLSDRKIIEPWAFPPRRRAIQPGPRTT